MITVEQIVGARGFLGWTQGDLSRYSGVSEKAIKKIEQAKTDNPRKATLNLIITAFENNGIEFIEDGIRKVKDRVKVYEGQKGIDHLFHDIIVTLRDKPEDQRSLMVSSVDEEKFQQYYPEDQLLENIKLRQKYNINQKLLLSTANSKLIGSADTYRFIDDNYFSFSPTFIYSDKVALMVFEPKLEIIIIKNHHIAEERRKNFMLLWEKNNAS